MIFFVLQKKNLTVKKNQKVFFTKRIPTDRKFQKCCEAKEMQKGHISGRRKNFNQKKNQN